MEQRAAVCLLCRILDQINGNINGDLNNSGSFSAGMLQQLKTLQFPLEAGVPCWNGACALDVSMNL